MPHGTVGTVNMMSLLYGERYMHGHGAGIRVASWLASMKAQIQPNYYKRLPATNQFKPAAIPLSTRLKTKPTQNNIVCVAIYSYMCNCEILIASYSLLHCGTTIVELREKTYIASYVAFC